MKLDLTKVRKSETDAQSIVDLARTIAASGNLLAALHLQALEIALDISADHLAIATRHTIIGADKVAAYHQRKADAAEWIADFCVFALDAYLDKQIRAAADVSKLQA